MNKEQLIEQLKELRTHLPKGELDQARIENENEISNLEATLSDPNAYTDAKASFYNAGRISNYNRAIANARTIVKERQDAIPVLNSRISTANKELERIPEQIESFQREKRTLDRIWRAGKISDDMYAENSAILESNISARQLREAELKGDIAEYESDIERYQNEIANQTAKAERYETLLHNFTERVNRSNSNTDIGKKMADEERLADLRKIQENLDGQFEYSNLDFADELDDIISNLENDTMTPEAALESLRDYRNNNMSDAFVTKTEEEKQEELSKIEVAQSNLSMEISDLQTKLADPNAYLKSSFLSEVEEDRIMMVEENMNLASQRVVSDETEIAFLTNQIEEINASIEAAEQYQVHINQEIINKKALLLTVKDDATKEMLNTEIANSEEEIKIQQSSVEAYYAEISSIQTKIKSLEESRQIQLSKVERYSSLIEKMQKNNSNITNEHARRLDENKLVKLQASLAALESRKNFLEYNFVQELDAILESKEEKQEEPVVDDVVEEPVASDVVEEPVVETPIEEPVEEEVTALVPYKGPIGVAAFDEASPELKDNIKKNRLLDKFKSFLSRIKNDFKQNWLKYTTVFACAMAVALAVKNGASQTILPQDNTKDDNDHNIESDFIADTETTELESIVDNALDELDAEKESSTKNENSVTEDKNSDSKDSDSKDVENSELSNNGLGSGTSGGYNGSGSTETATPGVTGGEVIDRVEEVIEDNVITTPIEDKVIHEQTPDTSIGSGTTETGGELIEDKTEIIDDIVNAPTNGIIHEQTPDTSIGSGTTETGGEIIDVTEEEVKDTNDDNSIEDGIVEEEVIEDDVVLPDLSTFTLGDSETYTLETPGNDITVNDLGEVNDDYSVINDVTLNDNGTVDVTIDNNAVTGGEIIDYVEEDADLDVDDLTAILDAAGLDQNSLDQNTNSMGGK